MRLGSAAEPVIIDEVERMLGEPVTRRQEVVVHPNNKMFMATIDGWLAGSACLVEVKYLAPQVEGFSYAYPQMAHAMACTNAQQGLLALCQGTTLQLIDVVRDRLEYEAELDTRCSAFLLCMQTLTPPCALPPVIPPEKWRTVDLDTEAPNWGPELLSTLAVYEATKPYAEQCEAAGKAARELVPPDVGKIITTTHTITRNRKGVLAIRSAK